MTELPPSIAPSDLFSVAGRTAVVTGGGSGIGLMIAAGLLDAGARVIIASRKQANLEEAAQALSARGEVHAIAADLSTLEGVNGLAAAVAEIAPEVHILVNNAGATWGAPVDEFPESGWDKVLDTNVKGVFFLTTALLPQLRAAATAERPATVLMVGSIDGIGVPITESYSYSASKAAVHMVARHLARRLAGDHITVNAIAPGPFPSKMMAFVQQDEGLNRAIIEGVPLGRWGRASDAAGAAIFLASPAGAYVTGVVLPVDGGTNGTMGGVIAVD